MKIKQQPQIKPLSRKKKDYRLLCRFFYTASPSLACLGLVKAGCKIAPNGLPCSRCRNCKYGIIQYIHVDEMHEIDGGLSISGHIENKGVK